VAGYQGASTLDRPPWGTGVATPTLLTLRHLLLIADALKSRMAAVGTVELSRGGAMHELPGPLNRLMPREKSRQPSSRAPLAGLTSPRCAACACEVESAPLRRGGSIFCSFECALSALIPGAYLG